MTRKKERASRSRKRFDLATMRRREIEAIARHVGAADSDDFETYAIAWAWHADKLKHRAWALTEAAHKMGRKGFIEADAAAIINEASKTPQRRDADALARWLRLDYDTRCRLGISTIGSHNVPKAGRAEIQKCRRREAMKRLRRSRGAKPREEYEANSLSRTKPWAQLGMSRAKWYRVRCETSPLTPVLLHKGSNEVVSECVERKEDGTSDGKGLSV